MKLKKRVKRVARVLYNKFLRHRLPYKIGVYNGIPLYKIKLLDMSGEVDLELEQELLNGIRSVVKEGDKVVIVGGGYGLSSIVCARLVGDSGEVLTFEAGKEQSKLLKKNLNLNEVKDHVEIQHAVVGPEIQPFTEVGDAKNVNPASIPECDILVLDCEGAEKEIISNLQITPRAIVVETHGFLGATPEMVLKRLNELDYQVLTQEYENKERGVQIITACNDV